MKCSEALKRLKKDGWYVVSQKGSHLKMKHFEKEGTIIFPNHGSRELAKIYLSIYYSIPNATNA